MSGARRWVALGALVVIGAVQVGVPALGLFDDRPGRFGWHMYSTINPAPGASVEGPDGVLTPVDLSALVADPRAEIRWSEPLAELLCPGDGAVAVVVTDREGTTRVPCR